MEVTCINHPRGHSHQYKMFRVTLSSTRSKYKIGMRKLKKMKPQQKRRNWPGFNRK
jgi:hypothetical protein